LNRKSESLAKSNGKAKNRYKKEAKQPRDYRRAMATTLRAMSGVAVIIGMSLVFVYCHDWITHCDYFRAEKVIVSGTDRLDPVAIQKVANLWEGVNVLSVNLSMVRKRLLSEPWIADVEIRREFPATITIAIREHRPLAVIDLGRPFLINTEGRIFKETEHGRFAQLPIITGIDYLDWRMEGKPGSQVFDAVMDVLLLGSDRAHLLNNERIDQIIVDREIGLTLRTESPVSVIELGYGDFEKKYQRFTRISDHLNRTEQKQIFYSLDLRNPDRIVARPVTENIIAGKGGVT